MTRFTPVLIHGDFDTSNFLISQKNKELTGIIDFEECQIGDPAADLLFFQEEHLFCHPL